MNTLSNFKCYLCNSKELRKIYSITEKTSVYLCQSCNHKQSFSSPPLDWSKVYSSDYYTREHSNWFLYPDYPFFQWITNKIQQHFSAQDISILDIGCGRGDLLGFLINQGYNHCYGNDINNEASKINLKHHYVGDITALKVNQKFDVIMSMMHIEHVTNPNEVIDTIHHLLKPEGILIIYTIDENAFIFKIAQILHKLGLKVLVRRLFSDHHTNHFSRQSLSFLLEKNNFKTISYHAKNYPLKSTDTGFQGWLHMLMLSFLIPLNFVSKIFNRTIAQIVIAKKS